MNKLLWHVLIVAIAPALFVRAGADPWVDEGELSLSASS